MTSERAQDVLHRIALIEMMIEWRSPSERDVMLWTARLRQFGIHPSRALRLTGDQKDEIAGSWRGGPYSTFEQSLVIIAERS